MDRRTFLGWFSVGTLASFLPVAIAACSPSSKQEKVTDKEKSETTAAPRADGFLAIGTVQQLEEKGYLLSKKDGVIVVRKTEDGTLSALNPMCPHQGCTVNWKQDSNNLVCPCHSSKFTADGKVVAGPANEPLASYEVKEEEEQILVKIG